MALLNDIKRMQGEGKTEQEIIAALKEQGISPREISDSISQSRIKEAVSGEVETPTPAQQETTMPMPDQGTPQLSQEMQPSQPVEQEYIQAAQMPPVEQPAQYPSEQPAQAAYPEYQQYQQYPQGGGISPDTITEISEQVVSEKLSSLKRDIENILDLKTSVSSKLESVDERLTRIEKIMDRLNLSILQKVGDYMSNINDIKKELIETQKSFKTLAPSLDLDKSKKQQPPQRSYSV